jgi:hypothetical protein
MTANRSLPLRYGLKAKYVTRSQIAAQQRAQARKRAKHDDDQLQLDEDLEP